MNSTNMTQDDLDEAVHEVFADLAAAVNNEGRDAQEQVLRLTGPLRAMPPDAVEDMTEAIGQIADLIRSTDPEAVMAPLSGADVIEELLLWKERHVELLELLGGGQTFKSDAQFQAESLEASKAAVARDRE